MSRIVSIRIIVHTPIGVFYSKWFEEKDVADVRNLVVQAANNELNHLRFRSQFELGINDSYTIIPGTVLANSVILTEEISDE